MPNNNQNSHFRAPRVREPLPELDRTDRRLLDLLQQDGSLSNLELAENVGLSPSPCSRRIKALQDMGLIEGYRAHLNARKLGLDLLALVNISMDKHTPERFEAFESQVAQCPEVLECYLITGQSADYVLKIIVRDMEDYQHFLLGTLTRIEGVSGVHSSFVMRKVIDRSALPVF
ncbi:Lrp/AsnC family transcriptional regulator [Parathalassolituus penaei]|uniref:Lrp/AsnC family transcriptional regulator n=1 Tax=Parathalassolituus penaei TaxID=2997323 RepID=A0A9X3IUI1_9GAMM|nr:Lrp/AsnC family transcriptional regulator [Parathalassolituus penaei]MCY0966984.1 Lrp/AsnC family transcriptional regulator [Parathalassolituus penaei]